ncbi:MAG: glycosyltransferase family 2 protein [Lachnospiraceae bacterium]|nr:glycosyltransferase family 2 protein [Lachnospiraceae bacterium]
MNTISIIVPIFRGSYYIDGLIRQAESCSEKLSCGGRLELVFVNDDPSERLPESYHSTLIDIKILNTDINRGIHGARVRGLEACLGEYVLFLDQDDRIAPTYFSSQMECMENHDCAVCQLLHEKKRYYNTEYPFKKMMTKEYMLEKGSPIISPGQVLLRKKAIPEIWRKEILVNNGADDFFLWLCMAASGSSFALNEEILFEHMVRYDNTSWNSYRMLRSEEEMVYLLKKNRLFSEEEAGKLEKMLRDIQRKRQENLDKFRKMFYVLKDLSMAEENDLEHCLEKKGLYNIALYGGGYLGKYILKKLEKGRIKIHYIIDQNAAFLELGYPAFTLEEELEEVDAVIVTLVQKEEAVINGLKKKLRAVIVTVRELATELGQEEIIW